MLPPPTGPGTTLVPQQPAGVYAGVWWVTPLPRVVDSVGSPETTSLIKNIYPTYSALACQVFVVWGEEFGLSFVKLSHYACRLYLRKIPKGSLNNIPKTAPFPDQIQPVKIFQL